MNASSCVLAELPTGKTLTTHHSRKEQAWVKQHQQQLFAFLRHAAKEGNFFPASLGIQHLFLQSNMDVPFDGWIGVIMQLSLLVHHV